MNQHSWRFQPPAGDIQLHRNSTKNIQPEFNAFIPTARLERWDHSSAASLPEHQRPVDSQIAASHIEEYTAHRLEEKRARLCDFRRATAQRVATVEKRKRDEANARKLKLRQNVQRMLQESAAKAERAFRKQLQERNTPMQSEIKRIEQHTAHAYSRLASFCTHPVELKETPAQVQAREDAANLPVLHPSVPAGAAATGNDNAVLSAGQTIVPTSVETTFVAQEIRNKQTNKAAFWDQGLEPNQQLTREEEVHLVNALRKWEMHKERNGVRAMSGYVVKAKRPSSRK